MEKNGNELDEPKEWFDHILPLQEWLDQITSKCTTHCHKSIDRAIQYVRPEVVGLSEKETEIHEEYRKRFREFKESEKENNGRASQYTKMNELSTELQKYGIEHKCDIIHIIEKYRKYYLRQENEWIKQVDPNGGHYQNEIDWKKSPLALRDESDESFRNLYITMGYPPPKSFKRLRQLEEKSCKERDRVREVLAQRKKDKEMANNEESGNDEEIEIDLMKHLDDAKKFMESISCCHPGVGVSQCENTDEEKKICDEQRKSELTSKEKELKKQYVEKMELLKETKAAWEECQKKKLPGTKMKCWKLFNDAKSDFHTFQMRYFNEIAGIKKKLAKKGERLPSESVLTEQEQQTNIKSNKQYQKISAMAKEYNKNKGNKGPAQLHWDKRMAEMEKEEEERILRQIREKQLEQQMKAKEEEERRMDEIMKNVQVKKVDNLFKMEKDVSNKNVANDHLPVNSIEEENENNEKPDSFVANMRNNIKAKSKDVRKTLNAMLPKSEKGHRIKSEHIEVNDAGNDGEIEIGAASDVLEKIEKKGGIDKAMNKRKEKLGASARKKTTFSWGKQNDGNQIKQKYIHTHDDGYDKEIEISVAERALKRVENAAAAAQSVDYYDHLYDMDTNAYLDGYFVNEEYKNQNDLRVQIDLDMMIIGAGCLLLMLLLFCACAVIGGFVGYFVRKRQMRLCKLTRLDES